MASEIKESNQIKPNQETTRSLPRTWYISATNEWMNGLMAERTNECGKWQQNNTNLIWFPFHNLYSSFWLQTHRTVHIIQFSVFLM